MNEQEKIIFKKSFFMGKRLIKVKEKEILNGEHINKNVNKIKKKILNKEHINKRVNKIKKEKKSLFMT